MATSETAVPPPLQDLPTAKEKKYDRQLRLWGAAGQVALEETHVLLINNGTGVTGVETLKNLVLPGIGQFTILDSAIVDLPDLGVNFFLEYESLHKSRAEETVRLLSELNPDVRGHAMREPIDAFVDRADAFAPFTLIIVAAPINPAVLSKIQAHSQALQIPTIYLHSIGFYSTFSIFLPPAFPIVDTHPEPTATTDLRLLKPWPALQAFARKKTADMQKMNAHDKGHIPYVCLLLYYLEEWQAKHDGQVPTTYKEKQDFRDNYVGKESPDEENFQEAYGAVLKSLNPPTANSSVREILLCSETQDLSASSAPFWVIAKAIKQFYLKHGVLPLPGAVPDMKAQSADYIELQGIYKAKAREDCAEVTATVRGLERDTGRSPTLTIDDREIENFCKSAAHIHLIRGRRLLHLESGNPFHWGDRAVSLYHELSDPESLLPLYIAFVASDQFAAVRPIEEKIRQPMSAPKNDGSVEFSADADEITDIAYSALDALIEQAGESGAGEAEQIKDTLKGICFELARAGGAELHNIASLTGGLIAQEAIKIITKQYVPVDNTCVFDGMESRTRVFRL